MKRSSKHVIKFYNQRGTCEQWIKEGKYALKWTRLSCRFRANEVRLFLFGLAYNLANFMRTLALPKSIQHWSLTTLRDRLIKIGARMISHAGYHIFQMAEVCINASIFEQILNNLPMLMLNTE